MSNIVVAGGRVYSGLSDAGKIISIPVGGGPAVTELSGLGGPACLAADSTNLYWFDITGLTVSSRPLAGGVVTKLADAALQGYSLGLDNGTLYWTSIPPCRLVGSGKFDLTNCGGAVDWPSIQKVAVTGGPVTTIATGYSIPWGFAFDETYVYWTDGDIGTISRAPN
jgi:hypothetical protein